MTHHHFAPTPTVGFVGLGNMGRPLAANLVEFGLRTVAFDLAGTAQRAPAGAIAAESLRDLVSESQVVVLSLPDAAAVLEVARDLVAARGRTALVLDTSTIGPAAARAAAAELGKHGIQYCDAPVSGGVAGAKARTITVLFSGPDDAYGASLVVLNGLSDRHVRIGEEPGAGQVVKLANNFLSAAALAATSEAIAFGAEMGVAMDVMLQAINASSGRSQATADKFVNHVATGTYDSGFASGLMDKDVGLYLQSVQSCGSPSALGQVTADYWHAFAAAAPGVDFTRIYQFVTGALQDD